MKVVKWLTFEDMGSLKTFPNIELTMQLVRENKFVYIEGERLTSAGEIQEIRTTYSKEFKEV